MARTRFFCVSLATVLLVSGGVGCRTAVEDPPGESSEMRPPLEQVLARHAPSLMAIEGVVGVAQGLDDAGEDCLKILVVADTPELRRQIPTVLEGYPVILRPTGELEPK